MSHDCTQGHTAPHFDCPDCAQRAAAYRAGVLLARSDAKALVLERLYKLPGEPIRDDMSDAEIEAAMRRMVAKLDRAVQTL